MKSSELFGVGDVSLSTVNSSTDTGTFPGCDQGTALDPTQILVSYLIPASAERMNLYRNGILIYSTISQSNTSYVDIGLMEGQTYIYTCEAVIAGKAISGTKSLEVTTLSFNSPGFAGVINATALSARSVRVSWLPVDNSGIRAASFQIFGSPGTSVNWSTPPLATVPIGSYSTILSNLGDELPYTFGVRACSASMICDANTATRSLTLVDGGAPLTTGLTGISVANGTATLTAPWVASNGAVTKRNVYQSFVGGTDLSNYTLVKTVPVSDVTNPPTTITLTGLAESTSYFFIVQDEDSVGNSNGNSRFLSLQTGDQTPPSFSGITNLVRGTVSDPSATDRALTASWTAIGSQPTDPAGATSYLVYVTSANSPSAPADPCLLTTATATLNAQNNASGSNVLYELTQLTPRTTYRVCVKARDAAGNTSQTLSSISVTTLDITPPLFDGIQSLAYDNTLQKLVLTWNPSSSTDILLYRVKLWKNSATPSSPTLITFPHSTSATGTSITAVTYPFNEGDRVYALVDACDNASPNFGSQNCTQRIDASARSAVIPDITPPPGFSGILTAPDLFLPAQGQITVKWAAPTSWSDYRGFTVYFVNPSTNALTFAKDCPCSAAGCPDLLTSCTIAGLDAYRTYRLHVRAYDAVGNVTTYLDPAQTQYYADKRTSDTQVPTFTSNLTSVASPSGISLTWGSATDNQYASESGAVINYKLYRKAGTTFATATSPSADGTLLTTQASLTYADLTAGLNQGTKYFYTVCASDASGNTKCDGTIRSEDAPDNTPPTFIGINSLILGSPSDTVLRANFTAIDAQSVAHPDGASHYLVYTTTSVPPAVPADPCASGTLRNTIDASLYTALQSVDFDLSGLTSRTSYKVCIKARDLAGNISSTTASLGKITQDLTAPVFGGLVSASYDNPNAQVALTWGNATSTTNDVKEYKVRIWKNTTTPNTSDITIRFKAHPASALGATISSSEFAVVGGDVIYVVVDACDDAATYFGTQNCTNYALSTAKFFTVPDVTPPPNFSGITAASVNAGLEGQMNVTWAAPPDWSDYRGFKVFSVETDNSLTILKDCPCAASGCAEHLLSCLVTGLDAYRTYKFHVRAYDAANNITTYNNPASNFVAARTADTTAPVFSSNFSSAFSSSAPIGVNFSWSAATDNQTDAGAAMNYLIYRKLSSTFADTSHPEADGTLAVTQSAQTYLDPVTGLQEGGTYYYAVCAKDASNNMKCDTTNIKSQLIPDLTPPTVSAISSTKTITNKTWDLSWTASDNSTPTLQLVTNIYRKVSTTNTDFPTQSDTLYTSGTNMSSLTGQTNVPGTANLDRFVNYLVVTQDLSGNKTEKTISIWIDNLKPAVPVFTSPTAGATTTVLASNYAGTCYTTAAEPNGSIVVSGSGMKVISAQCNNGTLAIVAHFPPSDSLVTKTISVHADDGHGNQSADVSLSTQNSFSCPKTDPLSSLTSSYVGVPANPDVGVSYDFCVAKYEMRPARNADQSIWNGNFYAGTMFGGTCSTNGCRSSNYGSFGSGQSLFDARVDFHPISQPGTTPWGAIRRVEAIDECASLGSSYRLISNTEWQAIGRSVEMVDGNWSSGTVGQGKINQGHSDAVTDASAPCFGNNTGQFNSYTCALPASSNDSDGYYLTGNTSSSGWEQKRTHTLTTGEVIWDFAGNVYEWVMESTYTLSASPATSTTTEYTNNSYFPSGSTNRTLFAPFLSAGDSSFGMGTFTVTAVANAPVARGGSWSDSVSGVSGVSGVSVGIYSAVLGLADGNYTYTFNATTRFQNAGFRCIYRP